MWKMLSNYKLADDRRSFCNSLLVWLERPNVCCKILSCCTLEPCTINLETSDFSVGSNDNRSVPLKTQKFALFLLQLGKTINCPSCQGIQSYSSVQKDSSDNKNFRKYFLRKLVPRRQKVYKKCFEFVVEAENCYIFIPLNSKTLLPTVENDAYMINFSNICLSDVTTNPCANSGFGVLSAFELTNSINLLDSLDIPSNIPTENNCENLSNCFITKSWLIEKLFPILCKWSVAKANNTSTSKLPPSLSLIDCERYSSLYQELKQKYGVSLSQIWPEVTDPQKYVYEDVAIATYLLLLWSKERSLLGTESKQSFADLGCGNGLLVHILTSEGHRGIGYDIRRRKIWDIYEQFSIGTMLKEVTVAPGNLDLIKDYDWILGNHSDELTPWIPVMAVRCGFNKKFWVLPCCFYDFYGKYERSQSSHGQYDDYLAYIKSIGVECGFQVDTDVMRIPSTKRVCFVGMSKNYEQTKHEQIVKEINAHVFKKLNVAEAFSPRPVEIEVRNCTKIDRNIQTDVVSIIANHLLSCSDQIPLASGKMWNRGGKISLSKAMQLLSDSARITMKNECGGIQTLLRNHNQIFEVSSGEVRIRNWSCLSAKRKRKKTKQNSPNKCRKTKRCWFDKNHPDGCPRSDEECSFLHRSEEATDG